MLEAEMARVQLIAALAAASIAMLGGLHPAPARSLELEAALMVPSDGMAAPNQDFPTEFGDRAPHSVRSQSRARECATDDGREYSWPCTRPGSRY
jgi:hypothetical protein